MGGRLPSDGSVWIGGDGRVYRYLIDWLHLRLEKRSTGMGVEEKLGDMGVVTTTLETAVNWARTNAMWPMLFGLACCAIEMMSAQAGSYDMSRFGMELMRPSPRQSDLMIVAGRVSREM